MFMMYIVVPFWDIYKIGHKITTKISHMQIFFRKKIKKNAFCVLLVVLPGLEPGFTA